MSHLSQVRLLPLNTNIDARSGRLTAVEGDLEIPFSIQRIFYVYGVTPGDERGGHAHPHTDQLLIGLAGGLRVEVRSPDEARDFELTDAGVGLYLPRMLWVRLYDFATEGVCLVLASTHYAQGEVIRDWSEYVARAGSRALAG